jgi:hypothetical protein
MNVVIEGLILIDAVSTGRNITLQSGYTLGDATVPPNVRQTVNFYALEDAYGIPGIVPDSGIQNVKGASNIGLRVNHCSIGYADCPPKYPNGGPFGLWPEQGGGRTGPHNPRTLRSIQAWIEWNNKYR